MKICGIICEYNPFHNGHAFLLRNAREISGCDTIACVMSGNFTQRGDIAILDKYTRAKHAILAGADAVFELPAVFSISPAELFAKGSIKLLCSIPDFSVLAFGCETGEKKDFLQAAEFSLSESNKFKSVLHACLKAGKSYPRARTEAFFAEGNNTIAEFLRLPNNILGTEYMKALLYYKSNAEILPIHRTGSMHNDKELQSGLSSSSAIRSASYENNLRAIRKNVPSFVYKDLSRRIDPLLYKKLAIYSALSKSETELRKIADCNEGLENRIKAFAKSTSDYDELISKITTKRYTSSRIRRIFAASLLGITQEFISKCLKSTLYLKPLAIKKVRSNEIFSALSTASSPVLARKSDFAKLDKTARESCSVDTLADDVYSLISETHAYNKGPIFIE